MAVHLRPSQAEMALDRIAMSVEKLVAMQQPSNDALDFLASIDPAELDAEVMKRRSLSIPLFETALDILREWAATA